MSKDAPTAPTPKKPMTAAQGRKLEAAGHRWVRYAIQLLFFILAPALFSGAFNGIKYLCTQIGLGQAIEPTSFVVQLVAVLGFTVLFGRFFCGYACAFGTLGDYLYNAFEFVRKRTPLPRLQFPIALVRVLSLLKYVVLVGICIACFLGVWSAYSSNSPWVAFSAILAGSLNGIGPVALGLLIAIVVGMIVRERFFCQFLCPLGAVFSLMPVLGISEFTRTRAHCARNCGRCLEACPVSIWPDADALEHGECISCGRCADVCPMNNVNLVAFEKAEAKSARLAEEQARAAKLAAKAKEAESAIAADAAAESKSKPGADSAAGSVALKAASTAESAPKSDSAASASASIEAAQTSESKAAPESKTVKPAPKTARPLRKTREKWNLLRGSGIGYVLVKAALLLVVCWLVGAARYVPSFVELFGFSPFPW